MNARLPKLLNIGLAMLMAGLFIAAFLLNRKNYESSASVVESIAIKGFNAEADALISHIESAEKSMFDTLDTPQALAHDLFIISKERVVPACVVDPPPPVSRKVADEAFAQGLSLMPDWQAIPYFETAARLEAKTPDDLYQKIGALFNLHEYRKDNLTACRILYQINRSDISLTEPQKQFFNNLLSESDAHGAYVRKRLSQLQQKAASIDHQLINRNGARRVLIDDEILSIRNDGLAVLHTIRFRDKSEPTLETEPSGLIHREILPGHYFVLPDSTIDEAKTDIRRQYRAGNIILLILAGMGSALVSGTMAIASRQRRLNAMRTEFIATVSHELRTPLSLIRLHAETLKHGRVPEAKVAEYHQTLLTEAERLTGIVNNVLDFSRMERDQLQIHPEHVNLSELTEQTMDAFNDRLMQEGFTLERSIPPGIMGTVDRLAYSQIVFNLLDNAIKYSDGAKTIRIGLDVCEGWNILTVADQGIGIPDKLKKHIFEEFVRSDDSKVTARRGSGIGLSIAQRLADKMGGTIEVTDNQPQGSIFTVRLVS
ncbi:Sensor histidine kinase TmoS [Pontiella desulfatans]|uniref:histidine kinase n=1 Tax=Pontiella desulfatans TaxID=2750659 RepID=A0A6C2U975_PONDE|nr:HAMP domain-containing sensor histidine kinase [Pontiella desulfatans]VGO15936.1 Sensor histidine kinase TmoS [Pontiella desulfatans]